MSSSPTSTSQQQQQFASSSLASNPAITTSTTKKSTIVPLQVQRSIMEWLDEDLPNDSPARVARALGLPSNTFSGPDSRPRSNQPSSIRTNKNNNNNNNNSNSNNNNNNNIKSNNTRSATPRADGRRSSISGAGASSGVSPTRRKGTRRQRQKEHTHVFVENPSLPAIHPANSIWLYGSYEYKLQTPPDEAQRTVFRIIARLVERMQRLLDASTAAVARGDATSQEAMQDAANNAAIDAMMPPLPSSVLGTNVTRSTRSTTTTTTTQQPSHGIVDSSFPFSSSSPAYHTAGSNSNSNGVLPPNHPLQGAVASGRFRAKGHLVFDLISTRKHITQNFKNGLPYRLGEEIYEHCQRKYVECIATCFVGLTDNPAQRVGRDIFYQRSDDLSTSHLSFINIDYGHLFVVFPPDSRRLKETPLAPPPHQAGVEPHLLHQQLKSYDETNTRFLVDALSGAHDLTGSTIPGRPPPLAALATTRRQQEEALAKVQQFKQQQQQLFTSSNVSGGGGGAGGAGSTKSARRSQSLNTTSPTNNNTNDRNVTGAANDAAKLIAMHRQMFNNSPRGRQVQVQGSGTQKTHVWGSTNTSPNNSPSPNARATSGKR